MGCQKVHYKRHAMVVQGSNWDTMLLEIYSQKLFLLAQVYWASIDLRAARFAPFYAI